MIQGTKFKIVSLLILIVALSSFWAYAAQKTGAPAAPPVLPKGLPKMNNVADVPKTQDATIQRIQGQINEIIRMNETIKGQQQRDIQEIQRIMDQSRIHQRLLQELKAGEEGKREIKPSDVEVLISKEKLGIIEKETKKNKSDDQRRDRDDDSVNHKREQSLP